MKSPGTLLGANFGVTLPLTGDGLKSIKHPKGSLNPPNGASGCLME